MLIVPLACDLWFGCLFPEYMFWDNELNCFTAKFQDHLTESFTADITADLGSQVFAGATYDPEEKVVEVEITSELQKVFTKRTAAYMGLQVRYVSLPVQYDYRHYRTVFFGWPVVDFSFKFDENLEIRLRRFFKPGASGYSIPVLLNMDVCD